MRKIFRTTASRLAFAGMLVLPQLAHGATQAETTASVGTQAALARQLDTARNEIREQQREIDELKALVAQQGAAIAALQHGAAASPPALASTAPAQPAAPQVAPVTLAGATTSAAPVVVSQPATAPVPVNAPMPATSPAPVLAANQPVPALPAGTRPVGSTRFQAIAYFNESTIHQTSAGAPVAAEGTGFNIKRLYLGVEHQFSKAFSATVLTDIRNVVGTTSNGNNASNSSTSSTPVARALFIKNAYLQATVSPALTVRLGAAPMPWIPYLEGQYGYRHIENTLVERVKLGNSADWGVHVLGDLFGGHLSYQVSAVDGSGYSNVNVTKYVDVEGRISARYAGFYAAIGGYDGHLGKSVSTTTSMTFLPVYHSAQRLDLAVGYKSRLFGLGSEYFHAKNFASINSTTEDSSLGYAFFGNVLILPKLTAFGRYDWVRNIARLDEPTPVRDHYFNLGLQWEPVRVVDLALVYKREAIDNGSISTQNGTIGGSAGTRGTYDEVGLFGQFKF